MLIPRVPDDHAVAEWMDTRFQPTKVLDSVVIPAKGIQTGCRMHPPMVLLAMVREGDINQLAFLLDGSRVITTLRAAVRNRGDGTWAMAGCCDSVPDKSAPCVLYRKIRMRVTRMTMRAMCHCFGSTRAKKCLQKKKATSSVRAGDAHEKSTDKLSVKEFRDRFCIPNGVIVEFLNEGRMSCLLRKLKDAPSPSQRTIQRGLGSLCRRCSRNSSISPRFHRLHSSQHRPGADGMQHHKHAVQPRPHAAGAADSTKGGAKGHVVVRGAWAGLERPGGLSPNYSMVLPGPERRGHIVDWVEKASFACLNKLFEIDAKERHYKTLLSAESNGGRPGVPGEFKEADAEKRRALLDDREKRKNEGTLRKAPGQKRGAASSKESSSEKEEAGEEWEGSEGAHSSQVLLSANYSRGGAEAVCATPMEEAGAESQSQPSDDPDRLALVLVKGPPSKRPRSARNLRSGLIGRLQDRQQEIEVAPGETHPAVNVEAPNPEQESPSVASSGGDLVNDAACTSASPFSYAELEDKLKQIPPGLTIMPSAKMFEMVETLVSGLAAWPTTRFFTDLRTTDYMKAFASRHKDSEDQLR
ncbi:hypothetical protein CK203_041097 [Vitis vinifera]|uniref:Uncharacterized protein n=1 Tax=Vitis vinifera TaxID=29760 RepID=A0A438H9M8_VITVI|nr:hypothetical protein CK203_041097 [Vitis vinifera]